MDINLLVSIAILLLLAVIVVAAIARRRRSARLAERFGPEYQRAVQRTGSRAQAEAELRSREHRVYKLLDIVPLAPHEAQRFRMEWQGVQSRFVDNPRSAVTEADLLVRDVMMRRGYPMADFETQAADLSVDHPVVVDNYRAAHAIALRELHGQASTEDLRQALVHYRTLFDELLQPAPAQTRRGPVQDTRAGKIRGGLVPPERALASDRPARERPGER